MLPFNLASSVNSGRCITLGMFNRLPTSEFVSRGIETGSRRFRFVGTLRDLRKWPVEYKDLASELPVTFHPGTYYVFYHHMPNDSVELGYKVLPARLSAAGFQVVKAPKSPLDFEQPEPGQARFLIIFEKSGHRGRIFNRYDRNLGEVESHWKTWGSEAYVVVIDQ